MPIYEYKCEVCGHEFERFQRITDESVPVCEACGAPQTKRLISMSAFHLKGTGWYVTDYKGQNAGNQPSAPGEHSDGEAKKPTDGASSESSGAGESTAPTSTPTTSAGANTAQTNSAGAKSSSANMASAAGSAG